MAQGRETEILALYLTFREIGQSGMIGHATVLTTVPSGRLQSQRSISYARG